MIMKDLTPGHGLSTFVEYPCLLTAKITDCHYRSLLISNYTTTTCTHFDIFIKIVVIRHSI